LLYATVGQGAKISGASQKWFVVDKPDPTTVLVCPGTHHPALYADRILIQDMNWIAGHPPPLPLIAQCRIRHLQPLVDCEIRGTENGGYEIVLHQPLRGIAPGQVCGIYYNGLLCLGGGAITQRGPTYLDMQKELPGTLHPSGHNDMLA
jgi:tRNA U34 2-thiouridine synthase MnmA/TrmU